MGIELNMKMPKLKKTGNVGLSLHFGKKYILSLPGDAALVKAFPRLVDVVMERGRDFEDKNKLQIELQHICDLLLDIETGGKGKRKKEKN